MSQHDGLAREIEALIAKCEGRRKGVQTRPCGEYHVDSQDDWGYASCKRCGWAEPEHVIEALETAMMLTLDKWRTETTRRCLLASCGGLPGVGLAELAEDLASERENMPLDAYIARIQSALEGAYAAGVLQQQGVSGGTTDAEGAPQDLPLAPHHNYCNPGPGGVLVCIP